MEETFEPPDELRLGNTQLGYRWRPIVDRYEDRIEFFDEVVRQYIFEFSEGSVVDRTQATTSRVVEWRLTHLFEHRPCHRRNTDELRRFRHMRTYLARGCVVVWWRKDFGSYWDVRCIGLL
jgi:hypothetical protein